MDIERERPVNGVLGVLTAPAGLALAATVVCAAALYLALRRRATPAERERKRRQRVNARGKMTGASVVDIRGDELFYSYTVYGAQYTAAQDISGLRDCLPSAPGSLLGPATAKYDPANPANSILACEEWSGLRSAAGVGGEGSRD